jgi:hypothetical protein
MKSCERQRLGQRKGLLIQFMTQHGGLLVKVDHREAKDVLRGSLDSAIGLTNTTITDETKYELFDTILYVTTDVASAASRNSTMASSWSFSRGN